jgi:hypothetical protein
MASGHSTPGICRNEKRYVRGVGVKIEMQSGYHLTELRTPNIGQRPSLVRSQVLRTVLDKVFVQ